MSAPREALLALSLCGDELFNASSTLRKKSSADFDG